MKLIIAAAALVCTVSALVLKSLFPIALFGILLMAVFYIIFVICGFHADSKKSADDIFYVCSLAIIIGFFIFVNCI